MKLYFVRHGESEANLLHKFSNRGLKHGLTDRGKQQAHDLAHSLKAASVTAIYSSRLLRASQTAEILSNELGIGYEVTDALREYDCGVLEGKSDAASWQRYADLSAAWLDRREWEQRIEHGESFSDIQQRFVPFIDQLLLQYGTSAGAIVLVGHNGLYRCMLPVVLRNIDFQFSVKHEISHTTTVVAVLRPAGLICSSWGEIVLNTSE